jgi:lysophospholipase L1-like esterase
MSISRTKIPIFPTPVGCKWIALWCYLLNIAMKKFVHLMMAFLLLPGMLQNSEAVTVHTIGDSTMATYDEATTDKRGWGMMFQQFFYSDSVTVNNRSKSGASSKSFYLESGYWNTVKPQIKKGDYVFIQFAHNDEKDNGLDGDTVRATTDSTADYRGTSAQGSFKFYLRAYVNETRALGGIPVLVTPMCRKYFSGGTITRIGRHDLGEKFGVGESDHNYDYVWAMKQVAAEMGVQLIDLTAATKSLYESYGVDACTALLFCLDDSTHPNALGGTLVARLCAQAMVAQNILASSIHASSDVLVNPISHDFGKAYSGQTLTKEFTLSGFDLIPSSGTFTLSVTDGFTLSSTATGDYSTSISKTYANGNLDFARFYVAVKLTEPGVKTGTLTLTNGTVTKTIPLTATAIQLAGGTDVKLSWNLGTNTDYVLTGLAVPVAETFSSMLVSSYAAPKSGVDANGLYYTIWPAASGYTDRKTQRNVVEGLTWPAGEIDEVSTRFVQFGISASHGTVLNLDSIGLYVGGAGGSGMRCRISWSKNHFSDYTAIAEFTSMTANTMYAVTSIPVLALAEGDTLLLRVYPWYNGTATGKTICLADVTFHGIAVNTTAVDALKTSAINAYVKDGTAYINGVHEHCRLNVYDTTGRRVFSNFYTPFSELKFSIPSAIGIYICEIQSSNSSRRIKIHIP